LVFPTDDIYLGPKSFGPRRATVGIVWHTTEVSSTSRAAAVSTANYQKTNPGSYNFVIFDGGILLTVPYLEASGGVNPASAYWAPGRYPWLKQLYSAEAYRDPNAYLLNVAFSGKTSLASQMPANMIDTAARLTLWVEQQAWAADDLVFSGHQHWQTNRSDPSEFTIAAILARYAELSAQPAPEPVPVPTREERLAAEVNVLRAAKPTAARNWADWTKLTQEADGKPLRREDRLAGEAMYLRAAAT